MQRYTRVVAACLFVSLLVPLAGGCGKSQSLSELANLQKEGDEVVGIVLRYKELEQDSLEGISKYQDVRQVSILECKGVSDDMMKEIAKLKNLEELELLGVSVSDKGLAHLADHPKLKTVMLSNTKVDGSGLAHLNSVVNLELRGAAVTVAGAQTIVKLANLETLSIHCSKIKMTDFADLKGMTGLRELDCERTPSGKGVGAVVATIPNLESLKVGGIGLDDSELAEIGKISSLKVLDLSQAELTDDGLLHISELVDLERLYLGGCTSVSDEGLKQLGGLTKLTYLDLMGTSVNGSGLMHLAPLVSLELIEFDAEQFTHSKAIIKEFNAVVPNCEVSLVQA